MVAQAANSGDWRRIKIASQQILLLQLCVSRRHCGQCRMPSAIQQKQSLLLVLSLSRHVATICGFESSACAKANTVHTHTHTNPGVHANNVQNHMHDDAVEHWNTQLFDRIHRAQSVKLLWLAALVLLNNDARW